MIRSLIVITMMFFLARPAFADFEQSEDRLFIDWPDLLEEFDPMGGAFFVHAIVQEGGKILYVISRDFRGRVIPFGAFECGVTFAYLDNFTNGFRDIRCVSEDGIKNRTTYILRVSHNNGYEADIQ